MRLTALLCLTAVICLGLRAPAGIAAGQDPQDPPVRFRTGVDVVQLDVTVLDKDRQPVRGLTAEDFTIIEDGIPQPLVALTEIDIPDRELPAAAWMREVAPDVRDNAAPEGRLMAIVMDDATMPPDAAMVSGARRVAREVVERLGPSDMAAVVFTLDSRHAQDFTSDRARLFAAIDRFTFGPSHAGGGDELYYQYSIATLTRTAAFLSEVPRRRKALIYISIGVPVDIEAATTIVAISPETGSLAEGDMRRDLVDQVAQVTIPVRADVVEQVAQTFQQALRSNVNIYGIDPGGLGGMSNYVQRRGTGDIESRGMTPADAHRAGRLRTDFLQTVSENSGGFATVNTNAPAGAIPRIFVENGSYYLLGYSPTNTAADGRYRRLEVRVNRPGVTVRARTGYYGPRQPSTREASTTAPEPNPSQALAAAMSGLLPRSDMPMQVTAAPFARRGGQPALAIVARLRQPAPAERMTQNVELLTSAFGPDGRPAGSQRQTARLVLRPSEHDAEYEVLSEIELKPGSYSLRIAATNPAIGTTGSVYHDVVIPDFAKDAVSLSGILLTASPGLASAPKDALKSLVPVVPTTQRDFGPGDQVKAFVRVYQGRRSPLGIVNVEISVRDAGDTKVYTAAETMTADWFDATRSADYPFEVPIERLAPGAYVLTMEAKLGFKASARRDVPFVVR